MAQIHNLAQVYHKLPSEILALSLGDYSLNVLIALAGQEQERIDSESRKRG